MYETKQLMQEFCSIATMLLHLDIASVEQLSSHVDIIVNYSFPSHYRPKTDKLPHLYYRGGYDLRISDFLSYN